MTKLALTFVFLLATIFLRAETMIIGIAGGTGSGKSTLAERLAEVLQDNAIIISEDAYYRDLSHLSFDERKAANFDHPNAIEFSLLEQHLIALKQGVTIEQPTYNFKTHARKSETRIVQPAQVIIVEGILLFAIPSIRDQLDLKVFVDVDNDIRLLRRIDRDMKERERKFPDIEQQYLETVRPMHEAFVEPSKQYADIIVPRGGQNQKAFQAILALLQTR